MRNANEGTGASVLQLKDWPVPFVLRRWHLAKRITEAIATALC